MDLVEISPLVDPPVCKLMDYGKYLFEASKKRQQARKNQKQIQVKEIKFRPTTDSGDYAIKLRKLTAFLEEGNKVKISLQFRGREMMHKDLGLKVMRRIESDLAVLGSVESSPALEGRRMIMVIAPKK